MTRGEFLFYLSTYFLHHHFFILLWDCVVPLHRLKDETTKENSFGSSIPFDLSLEHPRSTGGLFPDEDIDAELAMGANETK